MNRTRPLFGDCESSPYRMEMSTGSMLNSMVFSDTVRSTSNGGSSARSRLTADEDRIAKVGRTSMASRWIPAAPGRDDAVLQPLEAQLYFCIEGIARIRPRKKRSRALEEDGPEVFLKHLYRSADRPLGHRELIGSLRHRPQPSNRLKGPQRGKGGSSNFMHCIHSVHSTEVKHICFDRPGRGVILRKDPSALLRDPAGGFTLRPSAKNARPQLI